MAAGFTFLTISLHAVAMPTPRIAGRRPASSRLAATRVEIQAGFGF
jgi:hypothetical protein